MEEIWKDIIGFETLFMVSSYGRIKAMSRPVRVGYGKFKNQREKIYQTNAKGKKRYPTCDLSKNGIKKSFSIHRLVAVHFIPNPNNLPQVNHKDGNRLNNVIDNLEWCTAKENIAHARENKLLVPKKGFESKKSTFKLYDIIKIKELSLTIQKRDIAKMYNVRTSKITKVLTGGYDVTNVTVTPNNPQ